MFVDVEITDGGFCERINKVIYWYGKFIQMQLD